jgi:hypothetical protein
MHRRSALCHLTTRIRSAAAPAPAPGSGANRPSILARFRARVAAARAARACPDPRLRLDAGLPDLGAGPRRVIPPLVAAWLH